MTRYTNEQWSAIVATLRHLDPSDAALADARFELEDALEIYQLAQRSPGQARTAAVRSWSRLEKLAKEAEGLWRRQLSHECGDAPLALAHNPETILQGLESLQKVARARVRELAGDDRAKARPQTRFYRCVLGVWTELGGELRFSRDPRTRRITGPLARYFEAAMAGIHGGSLENLPDIIGRPKRPQSAARS